MAQKSKDPVRDLWQDWENQFLREEQEDAYREATPDDADQPAQPIAEHDLMTAKEVCAKLRWSLSTLRRNTRSRKLAYIKRDGRVKFRRADVERYDKKRYISEE
jgi:excisionase family DNA binding protein